MGISIAPADRYTVWGGSMHRGQLKLKCPHPGRVAARGASLNNVDVAHSVETSSMNLTLERVLIVEDEENERTGLAELVSGWGYRTETATDGVEALEKIPVFAPSIVITDVKMPRMGGMELVERLADLAQPIAVVMVTAQKATDTAFHAGRLGVQDYIEKPIDVPSPALHSHQPGRDCEQARGKRIAAPQPARQRSVRQVGRRFRAHAGGFSAHRAGGP